MEQKIITKQNAYDGNFYEGYKKTENLYNDEIIEIFDNKVLIESFD